MKSPGGRPRRDPSGVSRTRPGVPMTDAEYASVLAFAKEAGVTPVEAVRRLVRMGLVALDQVGIRGMAP